MAKDKRRLLPVPPDIYFSKEFQDLSLTEQRKFLGVTVKTRPKIASQRKTKTNKRYKRVFAIQENAIRARNMLLSGYYLKEIGRVFKVDHTSIIALKKRYEREGVIFPPRLIYSKRAPDFLSYPITKLTIATEVIVKIEEPKEPTRPKTYVDYLQQEKEKNVALVVERMAKAKKTIDELHKWRKINGVKAIPDWEYNESIY